MVKSTDKNAVSPHMAANPMQLLTLFKVVCLVRCHLDMIAYFYARYRPQRRKVDSSYSGGCAVFAVDSDAIDPFASKFNS